VISNVFKPFRMVRERVYVKRRLFSGNPDFLMPQYLLPDIPGETPSFVRFMMGVTDGLAKADKRSQIFPAAQAVEAWKLGVATAGASKDTLENTINVGRELLTFNSGPFKSTFRNFFIRLFSDNNFEKEFLLNVQWYQDDPRRLVTDPPPLSPLERSILKNQDLEALTREMTVTKGLQETIHFLARLFSYYYFGGGVVRLVLLLVKGGEGTRGNGKLHNDNAACSPLVTDRDQAFGVFKTDAGFFHQSPFLKMFIGPRMDQGHMGEPNPCDPIGEDGKPEINSEHEKLLEKFKNEPNPTNAFSTWQGENWSLRDTQDGHMLEAPKEMDLLIEKLRKQYDTPGPKDILGKTTDSECKKYLAWWRCNYGL
jgi:hypothetical protein